MAFARFVTSTARGAVRRVARVMSLILLEDNRQARAAFLSAKALGRLSRRRRGERRPHLLEVRLEEGELRQVEQRRVLLRL